LRVLDNILGLMKTHQAGMRPVATAMKTGRAAPAAC